ncbi:MAG: hypothetical protein AB8H86_09035 [Polyangiales bacterium]
MKRMCLALLLMAFVSMAAAQPAPDPVVSPVDAGPAADADADANDETAGDEEGTVLGAPEAHAEALERARHRIAELEALLDGEPLPGSRFETLFSVDIRRPELRDAERERLRSLQVVAALVADSAEADDTDPDGADAGVSDAGPDAAPDAAHDAEIDAGVADAGGANADSGDDGAGQPAEGEPAEGETAEGEPSEGEPAEGETTDPAGSEAALSDAVAEELATLEARANKLRFDLLALSEHDLDARLSALEARQSIDARIAESEAAAAEADEARRRAEEATVRANAEALAARNERERSIAESRALLQGERAAIAARLGEAARARQAGHEAEERRLATIGDVQSAIRAGDLSPERADEFYEALVDVLIDTRRALREALDRRDELPAPASLTAGRETLRADIEETRLAREEAQETLQRLAREYVRALSSTLHDGNELRLELLQFVSPARGDALVGFGDEGRAQLLREVGQLELMTRATARRVQEDLDTYPAQLWALATEPETRSLFISLLGIIFGTILLWRRRETLAAYVGRRLAAAVGPSRWRGWVGRTFSRAEAALGSLIAIVGTMIAMSVGRRLEFGTGFELAVHVSIAWGVYRLCVRLVTHELSGRSSHVRPEERKPVERSVTRIGRFALISYLLLNMSSGIVGKGTLHSYLVRVLILGSVVLGLATFFRWRNAIDRYYLETHPDGRLVPAIKTGGVHIHMPATLVALGVVTWDWALETVQGLAGGFALGRRTLAFFSERKVTSTDGVETANDAEGLPFELTPAPGACIDVYPEMDALIARAGSERGGAFALVGECGSGKTLWLEEAERKTGALSAVVPCECHDPAEFVKWLPKALGHEGNLETLAEELANGPARTILLDECQNLFLRRIGGAEPFVELATLVGRTQHRVVWCCSFTLHAWSYLRSAAAGQQMFESIVSLSGWSEEDVEQMCMRRIRQAGLKVDFGSMVDPALIGRPRGRAIQRAKEELFRLLWHYSGGNPRVALHYWQRSLRPAGDKRWSAKIFAKPDTEVLNQIHIETLFVLASVTLHKNLSPTELASTLRISHVRSVSLLQLLETRSLLICEEGRYSLSTHWYREVIIRLKRRRLLFS